MCADFGTKKAKDGSIWPYEKVEKLQVRARHQHLDIRCNLKLIFLTTRFKDNLPRFRMCVSDIQGVVNELVVRTKPGQVEVIFEPGTRKFPYGKPNLKEASNTNSKNGRSEGGFKRTTQKITTTMFKDQDDDTKKQIMEQENDLDELSDILGDLNAIANTMGTELDRQNEQLDRVDRRVDEGNAKLKRTNQRIDKLL